MFKRVVVLLVLSLYVSATAGFAMNLHYCGTKVSSVSVNPSKTTPCCKSAKKPMKCCHDKSLKLKVSDKHKPAAEPVKAKPTGIELFFEAVDYFGPLNVLRPKNDIAYYRGPPASKTIPATILNCTFRI